MEPMNCTAHVTDGAVTLWVPTQSPGGHQALAAKLAGVAPEQVTVHTTMLGGGFGRRGEPDFVTDAVETSKAVKAPVKVVWTREDDIQHGFYRPATYNRLRARVNAQGQPEAWWHRIVGPGILIQKGRAKPGSVDASAVSGAADLPYDIPNLLVEWKEKDFGVPLGFWRSVGSSQNAFVTESFIDELAHAAGKDPFEFRRALLAKAKRHKDVLETAALKANWGAPLPAGRARGIAVAFSYGSYAAHVAEVSVGSDGTVRVHKLVCAIDCGLAVNPDQIRAQMEGGAVYAMTGMYDQITLDKGRVQQSNFHDYPMIRMAEAPVVETHIVDSDAAPGGLGEPGVPTVAPSITNAIFVLTGKRIRRLPIRPEDLKKA
jgi:isoquinoline 1-oxidoreductase beta subunit